MKKLIIAAAALALAGCVSAPVDRSKPFPAAPKVAPTKPSTFTGPSRSNLAAGAQSYTLNSREIEGIKEGVRRSLKDPRSAMFGGMRAVKKPGEPGIYVCGVVNAKNSFGGYTGDQLYMGLLASAQTGSVNLTHFSTTSLGESTTETMCRLYGVM